MFRDKVYPHGIHESWYRLRIAALGRIVVDWLDEHVISYTRDQDDASAE